MYHPYNPNNSPIPPVQFHQPGLGYGNYAAVPVAPVVLSRYTPPQTVKSPLKKGDRGADVTYAWKMFWNMGNYEGEKPVQTADSKYTQAANIFSSEYDYENPAHWVEAKTGIFGDLLEKRVKWFQAEQGLPSTGIIDAATWKELGRINGIAVEVGVTNMSASHDATSAQKKMLNNVLFTIGAVSVLGFGWYWMSRR